MMEEKEEEEEEEMGHSTAQSPPCSSRMKGMTMRMEGGGGEGGRGEPKRGTKEESRKPDSSVTSE